MKVITQKKNMISCPSNWFKQIPGTVLACGGIASASECSVLGQDVKVAPTEHVARAIMGGVQGPALEPLVESREQAHRSSQVLASLSAFGELSTIIIKMLSWLYIYAGGYINRQLRMSFPCM